MSGTDRVLERAVRAFAVGDAEGAAALMAPDIVWHSPGRRQPAAGDHAGLENVLGAFGTIASEPGELRLEIVDSLVGPAHEAVIYRHLRARDGKDLDAAITLIGRSESGKLVEVWEYIYDLHAFDDFYGGMT